MEFSSTSDKALLLDFRTAIQNPLYSKGGFIIPRNPRDLRRWILHVNEHTPFSSIMGTLLSSFINDEYSPIICETIATKAFGTFEPVIRQLEERLFILELFHGPTLSHRDFGVSFLTSALDTIFCLEGGHALFLDVSTGSLGVTLAHSLRDKANIKAVILYPKGMIRGISKEDFVWNGGNVYPIEVDGTADDCFALLRAITEDSTFIQKHHITTSTSINIGRLLPQASFYTYAFSRIKSKICGDIFYALEGGNYSNVVALLYSWAFALPLNGCIIPTKSYLEQNNFSDKAIFDKVDKSYDAATTDCSRVCNLARLKTLYNNNPLIMRHFIYPQVVLNEESQDACKTLYKKYGIIADEGTASAFAALTKYETDSIDEPNSYVLVAKDDPAFNSAFVYKALGKALTENEKTKSITQKTILPKDHPPILNNKEGVVDLRGILSMLG